MYATTQSVTSESQLNEVSDVGDGKSERPQPVLVIMLAVVLFFVFGATVAVLVIASSGGDDTGRDFSATQPGDDFSSIATDETLIIPPLVPATVPSEARKSPSVITVEPVTDATPFFFTDTEFTPHESSTPRTFKPTHPPGIQTCTPGGYYGKPLGRLHAPSNVVFGFVYAASENSVVIAYLTYDGMDESAHFWAEFAQGDSNNTAGEKIPDETGSYDTLKAYNSKTVYLRLPRKITSYRNLGIYSSKAKTYLGAVPIQSSFGLPSRQRLGKPEFKYANIRADDVVLIDSATMILMRFMYAGQCPHAYFAVARTSRPVPGELTYLTYDGGKVGEIGSYNGTDVYIELPKGCHWVQFNWFSVFCISGGSLLGIKIKRPSAEKLPLHDPESAIGG